MKFIKFLTRIDRRIVYLILALAVILPLVFPRAEKVTPMRPVARLFEAIDTIPEEKGLILDVGYAPQIKAECEPMAVAILRHAFKNRTKVLIVSLYVQMIGLAQRVLTQVTDEFNSVAVSRADSIIYGRDYVFLGWQPPPIIPMLGMGESITAVYPVDNYGNQTDTLEIMEDIRSYNNIGILVTLSGSRIPISWVAYAQNRFGVQVGVGCTAVSAADFYPYFQTGQFSGLMVGMKGAAEYEELVYSEKGVAGRRIASEAVLPLTFSHIVIIVFIIIGNIGYFLERRRKQ